mgnify:CR=1 FL=1
MKKILRYIVAVIFIASGFVKAIDVKGFSFKLEEYFSPDVFNLTFLQNFTLEIAIFVVALELILGLMLLLKMKLKCTLISLIALCVFFAFLTFYSAYFNKVTDCGCFGDALKLTPFESFIKDLVLTVFILIFSEIIPKTIGASYWRNLALPSGQLMHYLVIITYPSVVISELITRFFSKKEANSVSREEISAMANIGAKEGIFDENENKIIQNLIKLKILRVNEVMTPRVVMVSADEDMTLEEFLENKDFLYFSRIPIYKKNQENITGYIFRENVFEKLAESHENLTLKDLKREIVTVHDNKLLFDLWNFLLGKKEHIALVLDEYGGVDGIITMEDIIETLLGLEIIDEKDSISDMREYAKDRWEKRKMKYNKLNNND